MFEDREVMRKKYIMSLENRTPDQIAEEEALYVEVKRLEHNERKFKRDREALLRTLAGIDSGLPDIVEDDGVPLGITGDASGTKTKKKKGGQTTDLDSPATPSVASIPASKRPHSAKNAVYGMIFHTLFPILFYPKFLADLQHCITRTDVPSTGVATKAAHQPAYLRSFKLPTPKAAIAPKITQSLAELGISHTRLVMPTRENVQRLEALLEATTSLVETKRVVDKVEYDIQVLKNRLGLREQSQSVDGETKMEGGDPMDVNSSQVGDAENEGEDGRGQSVISVRSGRSRKHVSCIFFRRTVANHLSCTSATAFNVYFVRGYCLHESWHQTTETQLTRRYFHPIIRSRCNAWGKNKCVHARYKINYDIKESNDIKTMEYYCRRTIIVGNAKSVLKN